MIFGKLVSNNERINEVNEILNEVFVKELKYENKDIFNISDKQVYHALVYEGLSEEKAAATGRLEINKENAYIKWIAVRKNFRRQLYGDMIVRMLTEKAKDLSINNIFVEVPFNLTKMFQKIGFIYCDNKDEENTEKKEAGFIIMKYKDRQVMCCK